MHFFCSGTECIDRMALKRIIIRIRVCISTKEQKKCFVHSVCWLLLLKMISEALCARRVYNKMLMVTPKSLECNYDNSQVNSMQWTISRLMHDINTPNAIKSRLEQIKWFRFAFHSAKATTTMQTQWQNTIHGVIERDEKEMAHTKNERTSTNKRARCSGTADLVDSFISHCQHNHQLVCESLSMHNNNDMTFLLCCAKTQH